MAKFVNTKTGNTLTVSNPITIELMEKSERYMPVNEPAAKNSATSAKG